LDETSDVDVLQLLTSFVFETAPLQVKVKTRLSLRTIAQPKVLKARKTLNTHLPGFAQFPLNCCNFPTRAAEHGLNNKWAN